MPWLLNSPATSTTARHLTHKDESVAGHVRQSMICLGNVGSKEKKRKGKGAWVRVLGLRVLRLGKEKSPALEKWPGWRSG